MRYLPLLAVLLAGQASAQTVSAASRARVSMPTVNVIPLNSAPSINTTLMPMPGVALTPSLSAPSLNVMAAPAAVAPAVLAPAALAVSVVPAASKPVVVKAVKGAAITGAANVAVETRSVAPALTVLNAAASVEKPSDLGAQYDGSQARGDSPAAVTAAKTPARRASLLKRTALAAGALIMIPGTAFAQAATKVDPGLMTIVTDWAPIATAIAAVIGALIGLLSAREKDGSANAGKVFSATISYGAIAGASVFALLDLTKLAFLGAASMALAPLTAAVTTAALAQNAFATKFVDPATTPADRVVGAFPVVAASFGLSVAALAFLPVSSMLAIGTSLMMLSGAATALYTAIFRLEKSPADGPAAMGRGLALQSLMTGLALIVPAPYSLFFFGLGLWGFANVMRATSKEAWAAAPQSLRDRFKR